MFLSVIISDLKITGPTKTELPKTLGNDGFELPSARKISMSVAELETPSRASTDHLQTVLVMQMGQFIDHDITHAPNHGIDCCNKSLPSKIIFFITLYISNILFLMLHF